MRALLGLGRKTKLAVSLGAALAVLCLLSLALIVACEPLPAALAPGGQLEPSLRVFDRDGRFIDEHRPDQGRRAGGVQLEQLPEHVVAAVLAAEDARFFQHVGFDPLAMGRAAVQAVWHRQIVSGASTITQQLARNVVPRPRTLGGKLKELVIALRIERELDKNAILEEYLGRIEFAPQVRGLDAASRVLFDKPAQKLDLAEAALLAGLPRGPSLYDPTRGTERARKRRDRILLRMERAGLASQDAVQRALAQPVQLNRGPTRGPLRPQAEHLVRALASGQLVPEWPRGEVREVRTTLDAELQSAVQALARQTAQRLQAHQAESAAVLVVDNATREVLAYVGAPDFWSTTALGQNDGTRALRQPGSTLKPFVYGAAIEQLGFTAATLVPDIELHLPTPQGPYSPRNYDGRFHGPVRLREALGNSRNVPAVHTAQRLGPQRALAVLHRFGFSSLEEPASHYGAAIALGAGEVTLVELAAAYAALANDGAYQPLSFALSAVHADGRELLPPRGPGRAPRRALAPSTARLLTDILSDPHARSSAFGRDSVLDFPFPVAVKTGTSKGYRDNWTVGFTREVTVAVWVGNFDGRPMRDSSGVTGAGPLFHDVLLAAMRARAPAPLVDHGDFLQAEICTLSGQRATQDCPHRLRERFNAGHLPRERCTFHERVLVSATSGQRATPDCGDVVSRVFEAYPEPYTAWARAAGRPLAPVHFDARCPGAPPGVMQPGQTHRRGIAYPFAGARYTLDPALGPAQQQIVLRARGFAKDKRVHFVLNGRRLGPSTARHELAWSLERGTHQLYAEADGLRSDSVRFSVE